MPLVISSISAAEYLLFEETAEQRHEFVDGVMHAMAGDKKRNNRVVGRLYRLLAESA